MRVKNGLNNTSRMATGTDASIQSYIDHIDELFAYANEVCSEIGLPIVFGTQTIKATPETVLRRDPNIEAFITDMSFSGRSDGMLFRPQIKTALKTIKSILGDQTRSKNIIGAMQVGKSTTQDALEFAGPILFALTGAPYFTMYLGTQSSGNTVQTREGREKFHSLYDLIDISFVDGAGEVLRSTTLEEYRDMTPVEVKTLRNFCQNASISEYNRTVLEPARSKFAPEGFQSDELKAMADRAFKTGEAKIANYVQHQRTNKKASIELVEILCKQVSDKGFSVIMVIDEIHWGSDEGGVMDRFLKTLYSEFASDESRHVVVGVSATPFATSGIDGFENIYHEIGADYCGPTFYRGQMLPSDYVRTLPRIMSMAETGALWDIVLAAYTTEKSFTKWKEKNGYAGDWDDYREYFECEVRGILDEVMFDDEGDADTPIAVCLRGMSHNDKMQDFTAALYPEANPPVAIGHYNSKKENRANPTSMKRWVAENPLFRNQSRFLMTVTGAARMADAFPTFHIVDGVAKPLRWRYLDLSTKTEMIAALLQGLYGRCCGYGKIINGLAPIVMMSDANYQRLDEYHQQNGGVGGNLLKNVRTTGGSRRGRGQVNLDVNLADLAKLDPIFDTAFREAQTRIASVLTTTNAKSLQGNKQNSAPLWDVFTPEVLDAIEANATKLFPNILGTVELLRPKANVPVDAEGEYTEIHYHGYEPETGHTAVGFRKMRSDAERTGGNDTMLRATRRTKVSVNGRQPQLHVSPVLGKNGKAASWVLGEITFVLTKEIRFASTSDGTATGDGSAFSGFRSAQDMIDAYDARLLKVENIPTMVASGKCTQANADAFMDTVILREEDQ